MFPEQKLFTAENSCSPGRSSSRECVRGAVELSRPSCLLKTEASMWAPVLTGCTCAESVQRAFACFISLGKKKLEHQLRVTGAAGLGRDADSSGVQVLRTSQ